MQGINKRRIDKNSVFRNNWKKNEYNWIITKYNLSNYALKMKYKNYIFFKFMKRFHLNSSLSRIQSICVISGRSHWVFRRFHLSRMALHKLMDKGYIHGLRKSSW